MKIFSAIIFFFSYIYFSSSARAFLMGPEEAAECTIIHKGKIVLSELCTVQDGGDDNSELIYWTLSDEKSLLIHTKNGVILIDNKTRVIKCGEACFFTKDKNWKYIYNILRN